MTRDARRPWNASACLLRRSLALTSLITMCALIARGLTVGAQTPRFPHVEATGEQANVLTVPLVAGNYASAGIGNAASRFGVGTPTQYDVRTYPVDALSAGWYWDWTARQDAPRPYGVEFYLCVRLTQEGETEYAYYPDEASIAQTAAANPGMVWFIGNEPDRVLAQDDIMPAVYARAYRELYELIKRYDPTALIGAGNIVQPTPARLNYLDQVLEAYQIEYGTRMPVDVWVIHDYPLTEDPYASGAGVPPGVDESLATKLDLSRHVDVDLFAELIVVFREWMAANDYQYTPLILSEFGVLMPGPRSPDAQYAYDEFDEACVVAFMAATFDRLNTMSDVDTGYPHDGNRLVQRWAWYSLTGRPTDPQEAGWLEGWLYDADTRALSAAGRAWVDYVSELPRTVNLAPISVRAVRGVGTAGEIHGAPYLEAAVLNNGSTNATGVRVEFRHAEAVVASATIRSLSGGAVPRVIRVPWPDMPSTGPIDVEIVIDPSMQISETDESDNALSAPVTLPAM